MGVEGEKDKSQGNFRLEEDSELKALREEYIQMLESTHETVVLNATSRQKKILMQKL